MRSRCLCRCHTPPDVEHTPNVLVAVDTSDVLEAAVACDVCRHHHCPALSTPAAFKHERSTAAGLEAALKAVRSAGEGPE